MVDRTVVFTDGGYRCEKHERGLFILYILYCTDGSSNLLKDTIGVGPVVTTSMHATEIEARQHITILRFKSQVATMTRDLDVAREELNKYSTIKAAVNELIKAASEQYETQD